MDARDLYRRAATRKDGVLTPERASARISAYVYGNVLVLAVIAAASSAQVADGRAILLVLGTAVSTFLAHFFADLVAAATVRTGDGEQDRESALNEIRDASPILTSGSVPSLVLVLGWLDVLPTAWAQSLASALIAVRIASVPLVAERLRGTRLSFRLIAAGITTAVIAVLVVVVKVLLTH